MRRSNFFSAVFSLFLLVPASIIWAQTISSQKGLTTAIFPTQYGNVKVHLPDDVRSGDHISGTIVAEPKGSNAKQIEKNLAELVKYFVSVDGVKYSVDDRQGWSWIVKQDRQMSVPIELLNLSGAKIAELKYGFIRPVMGTDPIGYDCVIPTHALIGSPLRITGPFDGDASTTKCSLDSKQIDVLAESPRQCIVSYPDNVSGIKSLNVREKEKQLCTQQVSSVQMNVSAGKLNLLKGERTYIDVSVTGLQNLPDTAILTLNNISAGIVTMLPSDNVIIPVPPDSVGTGNFNKRFDIQSIKRGTFTVNVNLDLPEGQTDHPPTQPQPGDNPQPKDTTVPQPPHGDTTVALCPGCKCSCSADIIFEGKDGDILTYRVEVKAACTGSFGTPPCVPCGIVDAIINDWTISYSADKPIEVIGGNKGVFFKFKNPADGAFSLSVKVTVTCNSGSCTCTANTSYDPTIPLEPKDKCLCNTDCSIRKIATKCGEADFEADIKAECKSSSPKIKCAVAAIIYLWYIEDDGKGVAVINGRANGPGVKVKTNKTGSYTLFLKVTVICSDGSLCETVCKKEESVAECIIASEWCAGTSIKVKALGYYPKEPLLKDMRPGELIGLTVFGEDEDVLIQKSICNGIIGYTPHSPVPDEIYYTWEVISFGKRGGELLRKDGNSNTYQLPYCMEQYPVKDEIVVRLNNKGGKASDEEVVIVFTIEAVIEVNGYNGELSIGQGYAIPLRTIVTKITHRIDNRPADIICPDSKPCCTAILPAKWEKGIELWAPSEVKVEYTSDKFPDNLVLLNVEEAIDYDNLVLECFDPASEKITEKKITSIPDNIVYTWTVITGNARFIYNKGRSVALIHNYGTTNTVTIKCVITESNKQFTDSPPITLIKTISPRQKPMAIVALGNIDYQINDVPLVDKIKLPHKHSELEDMAAVAANKYSAAGYTAKIYYSAKHSIVDDFFKNPKVQAVMMMGHGDNGTIELSDGSTFGHWEVPNSAKSYWMCREVDNNLILHPTIREMSLMGCDTYHELWPERFFRLEKFRAFRGPVYSASYSSRIVTQIKNMKPTAPRIAPPE